MELGGEIVNHAPAVTKRLWPGFVLGWLCLLVAVTYFDGRLTVWSVVLLLLPLAFLSALTLLAALGVSFLFLRWDAFRRLWEHGPAAALLALLVGVVLFTYGLRFMDGPRPWPEAEVDPDDPERQVPGQLGVPAFAGLVLIVASVTHWPLRRDPAPRNAVG